MATPLNKMFVVARFLPDILATGLMLLLLFCCWCCFSFYCCWWLMLLLLLLFCCCWWWCCLSCCCCCCFSCCFVQKRKNEATSHPSLSPTYLTSQFPLFSQNSHSDVCSKYQSIVIFLATLVALHFTPVSEWVSGQSFGLQPSSVACCLPHIQPLQFQIKTFHNWVLSSMSHQIDEHRCWQICSHCEMPNWKLN